MTQARLDWAQVRLGQAQVFVGSVQAPGIVVQGPDKLATLAIPILKIASQERVDYIDGECRALCFPVDLVTR